MPKIDTRKAEVRTIARYPGGLHAITEGREKIMLGDVCGLTQFGVNLTRLKPGAYSAHRHWHENGSQHSGGYNQADRVRLLRTAVQPPHRQGVP